MKVASKENADEREAENDNQSIKSLWALDTRELVLKEMPAVKELKVCKKYSSTSLSFNFISSLLVTKNANNAWDTLIDRSFDRSIDRMYSQVASSIRMKYNERAYCLYCLLIVLLQPKEWQCINLPIHNSNQEKYLFNFFTGILNTLDTPGSRWNLNFRCESSK